MQLSDVIQASFSSPAFAPTFVGGNYYLSVGSNNDDLYVYSINPTTEDVNRIFEKTFIAPSQINGEQNVTSVAFSAEGFYVGGGSNSEQSRIYSLITDDPTQALILDASCIFAGDYSVRAVEFSPDGWYFLTGGDNGILGIFEYRIE